MFPKNNLSRRIPQPEDPMHVLTWAQGKNFDTRRLSNCPLNSARLLGRVTVFGALKNLSGLLGVACLAIDLGWWSLANHHRNHQWLHGKAWQSKRGCRGLQTFLPTGSLKTETSSIGTVSDWLIQEIAKTMTGTFHLILGLLHWVLPRKCIHFLFGHDLLSSRTKDLEGFSLWKRLLYIVVTLRPAGDEGSSFKQESAPHPPET